MNYFEVTKKENIGKAYEIFLNGESKGKWRIEDIGEDFDFLNEEEELLGEVYYTSQIVKMEFEEIHRMNIIEVSKRENIGKVYEIFIGDESKGEWELKEIGKDDFDFLNEEEELLGEIYYASQIVKMEFKEV